MSKSLTSSNYNTPAEKKKRWLKANRQILAAMAATIVAGDVADVKSIEDCVDQAEQILTTIDRRWDCEDVV